MEFFRKNPQAAEKLRGPIFEEKVVDFILELAKVTEKTRDARGAVGAARNRPARYRASPRRPAA